MSDELTESGSMDGPFDPIGAFDVLRIVATPDPEVRNHLVTLAYWEMSQTLDALLHEGFGPGRQRPSNANWFTMATWAISTVGRNIRANELPRRLDQMLPTGLRSQATPWLLSMRSSSGRRVQRALGHGQIVVFTSTMLAALEFVQRHEAQPISELNRILAEASDGRVDPRSRTFKDNISMLQKTRPFAVESLWQQVIVEERNTPPDEDVRLQREHLAEVTRHRGRLTAAQKEQLGQLVTSSDAVLDDENEDSEAPSTRQTDGQPPRASLVTEFLRLLDGEDETQGMDFLRKLVEILIESKEVEREPAGCIRGLRASQRGG